MTEVFWNDKINRIYRIEYLISQEVTRTNKNCNINRVNLVNHVLICLIYFEPHTRLLRAGYIGHIGRTHRENPKNELQLKKYLILIVLTIVTVNFLLI
jgi:hypothetical protein